MQSIIVPSRPTPLPPEGIPAHDRAAAPLQSLVRVRSSSMQQLLTAERLKDEFMAILSHELRSPLLAVQNAVRILSTEAGQEPAVQQQMHALIERQVRHMMLLTAGLGNISQLARGQLQPPLQRERIDLRLVLTNAMETMEPQLQQRNHRFATQLPDAPVWLQGDSERLDQVFRNLLDNASKFTNPGVALALSMHVRDGEAVVRVRDGGIGIAADALPNIFTLFMQADQGPRRVRPGLGIGLALVKTLVEMHGGRVSALSAGIGHGSEFTVRLPLEH
jgi:signal transduction histidine kinase